METLARVRLTFHGLRARNWHLPEGEQAVGPMGDDEEDSTFSATVDIRRLGQLLASQRVQPNWFVCSKFNPILCIAILILLDTRLILL